MFSPRVLYYRRPSGAIDYNGNDEYTVFLAHLDGANGSTVLTDSSPYGHKITLINGALNTSAKQLGTASFRCTVSQAHGFYVAYSDIINSALSFGTGDFTIDFWMLCASTSAAWRGILSTYETPNGTGYCIAIKPNTRQVSLFCNNAERITSSSNFSDGVWTHIAIVRYGNTVTMYMNGTSVGTWDVTGTSINAGTSCGLMLGRFYYNYNDYYCTAASDFYFDEVRVCKGIARWTSNFTVPSTPYGGGYGLDDYVKLLVRGNGSDASTSITDSSYYTPKAITVGGNAQIDTAQYKFDGSSILFDGSGDYIYAGDSDDWTSGSGDYTVDFWVRFNALPSGGGAQCFLAHITNTTNHWGLYVYESSGSYYLSLIQCISSFYNILIDSSALSLSTGTWYHIAMVKTGTTYKWFLNGLQVASTTETDVLDNFSQLNIATLDGSLYCLNGWLDTIRISKGIARWTADFTVPDKSYR